MRVRDQLRTGIISSPKAKSGTLTINLTLTTLTLTTLIGGKVWYAKHLKPESVKKQISEVKEGFDILVDTTGELSTFKHLFKNVVQPGGLFIAEKPSEDASMSYIRMVDVLNRGFLREGTTVVVDVDREVKNVIV